MCALMSIAAINPQNPRWNITTPAKNVDGKEKMYCLRGNPVALVNYPRGDPVALTILSDFQILGEEVDKGLK